VTKPSNVGSFAESQQNIREQLIPKLKALTGTRRAAGVAKIPVPTPAPAARKQRAGPYTVLAIGSSTGGPDALARVLPALPADLPVPVVVVQHMPPLFTRLLAQRLGQTSRVTVVEAHEGEPLAAGKVMIAPGGQHLTVRRQGTSVVAHLTEDPPENFCRPAVDVLFRSVSSVYADRVLAVVLTGMGRDGAAGAKVIRDAGGEVIAQDEATSVVWGMPGAVAMTGQADRILAIDRIGPDVAAALSRGPAPVGVAP
jgi:two-component system chemotaxis response regulator CheB